ncbi:MAG: cytochrome c [Anaerolineales bacterium]|nr:cytochrome c [Anaerolineales bacterium]
MERRLFVILMGGIAIMICGVCMLCVFPMAFLVSPVRYIAQANGPLVNENLGTSAASGEALFKQYGCAACHQTNGSGVGPSLAGIFGETVELADGTTVPVDEAYIRTSILDSQADLVAGYPPIMPKFDGQISDEEVDLLIEYIQTLSQ